MAETDRYIIYLHPQSYTIAYEQLDKYWNNLLLLQRECGIGKKNSAMNYPFHATLCSFFLELPPGAVQQEQPPDAIKKQPIEAIQNMKVDLEKLKVTCHNYRLMSKKDLIKIEFDSNFNEVFKDFKQKYKLNYRGDSLHVALAHEFDEADTERYNRYIAEVIDLSKWRDIDWTLKMWKIKGNVDTRQWTLLT